MWNKVIFLTLILVLSGAFFVAVLETSAYTSSTSYVIFADVFSAGGSENSSSTLYGLQDSIGEAIVSSSTAPTTTSATYGIKSGFRELYPDQSQPQSLYYLYWRDHNQGIGKNCCRHLQKD